MFYVYRIYYDAFVYYGITTEPKKRKYNHCRSIHRLIYGQRFKKKTCITRELLFHHKVAEYIFKREGAYSEVKWIEADMDFAVIYYSKDKADCKSVESFLIEKALAHDKMCCNVKIKC